MKNLYCQKRTIFYKLFLNLINKDKNTIYLYNCFTLKFINQRILLRVLLKIIQMLILNAQK